MKVIETKGSFPAEFRSFGHQHASFTNLIDTLTGTLHRTLIFHQECLTMAGPPSPTPPESTTAPRTAQACPFCAAGPRAGDHADLQMTCSSISTTRTVKNVFLVLSWGKNPLVPLGSLLALFPRSGLNTTILHNTLWPVLVDADNLLGTSSLTYLFLSSYFYIQCSRNYSLCKYVPEGRVRIFVLTQCTTNYS